MATPLESPLITKEAWAKQYPPNYAGPYKVHAILAQENSLDQKIKTCLNQNGTLLFVPDPSFYNLTPLMIAVMRHRTQFIERLSKQGITACDTFGWTALHHAYLASDALAVVLLKLGADKSRLNAMGATPLMIKNLIDKTPTNRAVSQTYFKNRCIGLLTSEELKSTFSLESFRAYSYYSRATISHLWQGNSFSVPPFLTKAFTSYVDKPSYLIIDESHESPCYSLFAGASLPVGSVVGELCGEVDYSHDSLTLTTLFSSPSATKAFLFPPYDMSKMGGVARFLNNGWPNCLFMKNFVLEGSPKTLILTGVPINKDEELFVDYGWAQPDKCFSSQKLIGRENMEGFFSRDFSYLSSLFQKNCKMIEGTSQKEKDPKKILPNILFNVCFLFPLNNPRALFHLHFSDRVSAKAWYDILKRQNPAPLLPWFESDPVAGFWTLILLKTLLNFENALDTQHPERRKILHAWLLKELERGTLHEILEAIDLLSQDFNTPLNELASRLNPKQWITSRRNPLGLERGANIIDQILDEIPGKEKKESTIKSILSDLRKRWLPYKQDLIEKLERLTSTSSSQSSSSNQ